MKILFLMDSPEYLRFYDTAVEELSLVKTIAAMADWIHAQQAETGPDEPDQQTLIVAHDALDEGKIVEVGPHAALLARPLTELLVPAWDPASKDLTATLMRTMLITPFLIMPAAAALMAMPFYLIDGFFARGAFTVANAAAAGATLAAYSIGLLPFVLLRSFTAPFYARGDTATPVKAALLAAAINILLKVLLMGHLAQVGLALATSVGAWINLSLLALFARRQGFAVSGAAIGKPVVKLLVAGVILAAALLGGSYGLERALASMAHFREETMLALFILLGAVVYGLAVFLLLGRPWLRSLLREVTVAADTKSPPDLETPDPTDDSSALPDNEPPPKV